MLVSTLRLGLLAGGTSTPTLLVEYTTIHTSTPSEVLSQSFLHTTHKEMDFIGVIIDGS